MRDPRLLEFAKRMRSEMNDPERALWNQLRGKRFQGVKFRRQHVLGHYIADFYSRDARLVIEVDGDRHAFQQDYDRIREDYMTRLGYRVIRFTNQDVLTNMEGVWRAIDGALTPPLPTLSPEGERAL